MQIAECMYYIIVSNISIIVDQSLTAVYVVSAQDERIHKDGCTRCVR